MSRSVGGVDAIQGVLPDWFAVLLSLLTQLGDGWFLVVLLAGLYWHQREEREDIVLVAGAYVAGVSSYQYLKYLFERPRPGQPLLEAEAVPWLVRPFYEATAFATGYGFPSGHATATTVVYLGLAAVLTVGSRRRRYLAAGCLVAIVSFTRVALGVHFLVDVVAGVVLGGTLLVVVFGGLTRVAADRVPLLLGLGIVVAVLAVVESGGDPATVVTLAGAVGLFGLWRWAGRERAV